jgi:dephospho-CoA kinase
VVTDPHRVRRIALTGGIATGKSYVRAKLEEIGVPTIDADTLAREVVEPGTPGFTAVVEHFGSAVVAADGSLNRRALGAIVFTDPEARRELERIVHPAVRLAMDEWFASLDPLRHPVAVADIPLLFETGRHREFDAAILTVCSPVTQLQRVLARDGITETEARQRIAAQLPSEAKVPHAMYVINTDGTFAATDEQIQAMVRRW